MGSYTSFVAKIAVGGLLLLLIGSYAWAEPTINLSGSDKVEHYFWGMAQHGLYRSWGYSDKQAWEMTFLVACLKELKDSYDGYYFDGNDVLATILGAWSFEVADGVYFRFRYVL